MALETLIEEWSKYRGEYTDELIRHEGLAGLSTPPPCHSCSEPNAVYRCLDCFFLCMLCQYCIVSAHQSDPLHTIQVSSFLVVVFNLQSNSHLPEVDR